MRSPGRQGIVGALAALAFAIVGSGLAHAADSPSRPVLYAGMPPGPEASAAVAAALADLESPIALDEPPTHVADLFPSPNVALLGASDVSACSGDRVDGEAFRAGLAELQRAIRALEDVTPRVDALRAMQVCLAEPVAPAELARVELLAGVVAHSDNDTSAAMDAFAQVFAYDPAHPWDPEFPPDPQIQFANAATSVAQAPRVRLSAVVPLGTSVWVDGRRVASPSDSLELPPGRHLVHTRILGEPATTALAFSVGGTGGEVVLVSPGAFRGEAALEGGLVASVERVLRGLEQEGTSRSPGHLVVLSPEPTVWAWDADSRTLVIAPRATVDEPMEPSVAPVDTDTPPPRPVDRGASPAGPILFAAGLGLAAGGGVMAYLSDRELDRLETSVGEGTPFPGEGETCDDVKGEARENCLDWERATDRLYVGYGLLAGGGALVAVSIPVGIGTAVNRRKALLTLRFQGAPPGIGDDGSPIRGVHVSFTLF